MFGFKPFELLKPTPIPDISICRDRLLHHYMLNSVKVYNNHARDIRRGGGRVYSTTPPPIPDVDKMSDDTVISKCKYLGLV